MISTPQEIEQEAIAIANWIVYRGPFVLPTDNGQKMYLCLLSEDEFGKLSEPTPEYVDAEIVEE